MAKKKGFRRTTEGNDKSSPTPSTLDVLLSKEKEVQPKVVEPKPEVKTAKAKKEVIIVPPVEPETDQPKVNEVKPVAQASNEVKEKQEEVQPKVEESKPESKKDGRTVNDKKLPFSSILKDSIQQEIKEILKLYRQNIDFEYNMAQFVEDGMRKQLGSLKRQLDKKEE